MLGWLARQHAGKPSQPVVNIRKSLDYTRPLPVSTPQPFIYDTQFRFRFPIPLFARAE
jgi:hypothetical protein